MKPKKNYMYFDYFRNISQLIKNWKNIYWVQFRDMCPVCKSKRLHFIEGFPRFAKWFCTDCTAMTYVHVCFNCKTKSFSTIKYKPHIYKEFRLGKYKDDDVFFNECQKEYFLDRINFYKQGTKEWNVLYKQWQKRKRRSVLYTHG